MPPEDDLHKLSVTGLFLSQAERIRLSLLRLPGFGPDLKVSPELAAIRRSSTISGGPRLA